MSINRVVLTGNLTRDAESRTTHGGMTIVSASLAVNDRRKNQNGEWEDVANYVDCVIFGKRGEALRQYLVKGSKVAIEGKLRYSSWEDRDTGKKRSKLEVVVDDVELLGGKPQRRQEPQPDMYASTELPF